MRDAARRRCRTRDCRAPPAASAGRSPAAAASVSKLRRDRADRRQVADTAAARRRRRRPRRTASTRLGRLPCSQRDAGAHQLGRGARRRRRPRRAAASCWSPASSWPASTWSSAVTSCSTAARPSLRCGLLPQQVAAERGEARAPAPRDRPAVALATRRPSRPGARPRRPRAGTRPAAPPRRAAQLVGAGLRGIVGRRAKWALLRLAADDGGAV